MNSQEELELLQEVKKIAVKAREFGLDFYDTYFEICPADILHTVAAYGMPVRFGHWSFGKSFFKIKSKYDYNLNRIYELVINANPCHAFLLDSNSPVQNKAVIAHVFAHSDFFKNNYYFSHTSRQMLDSMAVHAERITGFADRYGAREVEIVLDAVLSIQEHINPHVFCQTKEGAYDCDYKDLLLCIAKYGHYLEEWQREIIMLVREEMLYFWPQLQTKILNEGWATYWHTRIMHTLPLDSAEAVEFAKLNANITMRSGPNLNPYLIGFKLLEHIAANFGEQQLFNVREAENDLSLVRNYLTPELLTELDLYVYQSIGHEWVVVSTDPEEVKKELLKMLVNCGFPTILVADLDYQSKGELYLRHRYEDAELDIPFLEKTLPRIYLLWGRGVHLETVVDNRPVVFSYDGQKNSRHFL